MYIFEFLGDFLKARPLTVGTNLSFAFLYPVQDIMLPHYYGNLIESLIQNKQIFKNIVIVLSIFSLLELGFILSDWHDIGTIANFQTFCRQEILKNIMKKYETNYSDLFIGDLMSKLVKIPYTVVVFYERFKQFIIPYILVFGFATCYFGSFDKTLGICLLVTSIIYALVIAGIPQTYCRHPAKQKDSMLNQIHEEIDDTLRNFMAMHGDTDKQQEEIKRLEDFEELFTVKFAQTMKCLMKTKIYTSLTIVSFITVFILRSYTLLKKKVLNTATFSSLFLILIYITNSMIHLEGQLRDMIFDCGVLAESDDVFNKNPVKDTPKHQGQMYDFPKTPGIGMKNVSFKFPGSTNNVLEDISFHVNKGETIVILGEIGSGKSTILKLLLKFNEPEKGAIYIDGKTYQEMTVKEIKKKVGYVPQQPILFNRSVIDNITYGTENVTREQVQVFIKQIGVDKEFVNLEDGLDTKIGKNGNKLSGGQKQIVWTIRTYFQNPDIIILDEPTASLDHKSKETLKQILNVLMKEKTTIIVTHDNALLELADRKLYVKNGQISEKKDQGRAQTSFGNGYLMSGGLLDR
jgi:ATP-binding cassette, subfamily B, multidrug efflux pump